MARKTARPGRTLVVFLLGLGVAFGLVAIGGDWKPELGLDLQGGTSIRLTAEGSPSSESMEEARKIIDQRVNGSGVAEAEVTVQGNKYIVVEIPGQSRNELVETVKRQAQLRFRLVACSSANPGPCAGAPVTPPTEPGDGVLQPTDLPTDEATPEASPEATATANRPPVHYSDGESPTPSDPASPSDTASPSDSASPSDAASPSPGECDPADPENDQICAPPGGENVDKPLQWIDAPNQEAIDAYTKFECPVDGTPPNVQDDPDLPLVTCEFDEDDEGNKSVTKYLLSAAMIEGTALSSASAQVPQGQVSWVVSLEFDDVGSDQFAEISRALVCPSGEVPPCKQFAVVLDGQVISAPTMNALITNGKAQIEGNFTQESAESLATSLKYGALPISFSDFSSETIGASLAGDQLSAGLLAGAVGLLLVMIYCLIYYRGLGLVVLSSLAVAAASTYAMVLLLSKTANFTLTLPGIAGLIVAVGITADSFVVYFERIRDEMRDGKSMRVAVEAGWIRARNTCLAADAVSLLAAVVLFIFAAGVVKGFAFALGLSTIVDLVVFFFFTKPLVSVLARFRFFNRGHRLSGLDAGALGIDHITLDRPVATAGAAGGGLMGMFARLGNDLYSGRRSIDFVGRRWTWYAISALIVVGAILVLTIKGLNYGIEFTGGTQYKVSLPTSEVTQDNADAIRGAVADLGIPNASQPVVTTSGENAIVVQTEELTVRENTEVSNTIIETVGASDDDLSQEAIGASWGEEVRDRALLGLAVFLVLVVLFIWAYFRQWKMSVAALVALAHDVVITVGVYALSGFEVTPATVTGVLTILGFSLYDTVVVFDKVRENTKNLHQTRMTYAAAANLALNQTLVRSINTSLVALIPVGAILYVGAVQLGASSLKDLALALFVGMAAGTYSSVFIATPLLVHLKSGETEVVLAERRAKARQRRTADKYAAVPAFVDDMPLVDDPEDAVPGALLLDGELDELDPDDELVPGPERSRETEALGRGRVVPTTQRPVAPSAASGRQQPTRQPKSKRGHKK